MWYRGIIILLITIGTFWYAFDLKKTTLLNDLVDVSKATQYQIDQYAKLSGDFIDFLGIYGNEHFKKDYDIEPKHFDLLKYDSIKDIYTMDSLREYGLDKTCGNLTGLGALPGDKLRRRELYLAIEYNSYFYSFYNSLPGISWIYYTSKKKFVNIYPWVPSDEFKYMDELHAKEFYINGLKENNPMRKQFWTPVYLDLAGKGMMVTISRPIYAYDEFMGVVSVDFTLERLNELMNHKYRAFITNREGQIVASTFDGGELQKKIMNMNDLLEDYSGQQIKEIENTSDRQLQECDNDFVYSLYFSNAPWRLYYLIPRGEIVFKSVLSSLPVLIIGVLLMLSNYEASNRRNTAKKLKKTVEELSSYQKMLEQVAKKDFLTGALNRRGMIERMTQEVSRASRNNEKLTLVMGDVDLFKQYNDMYGHAAGDKILVAIVHVLRDNLRASDLISRWGGEEFLIMLPDTDYAEAKAAAEKLRRIIESTDVDIDDEIRTHVTVTFGVGEYDAGSGLDKCINNVDEAMYAGKNNGRNQVVGYMEITPG